MQNQENLRIIQKCYDDIGAGNIDGLIAVLADDVYWVDPGYPDIPWSGSSNGPQEVAAFCGRLFQSVQIIEYHVDTFLSDGDDVVAFGHYKGTVRATGKDYASEWAMRWTLKNGKVVHYQTFFDTLAVSKAAKP